MKITIEISDATTSKYNNSCNIRTTIEGDANRTAHIDLPPQIVKDVNAQPMSAIATAKRAAQLAEAVKRFVEAYFEDFGLRNRLETMEEVGKPLRSMTSPLEK